MRQAGLLLATTVLGLSLPLAAETRPSTAVELRPALYLLGTSERGHGAAYAPPRDGLKRDDAASLGFGIDAARSLERGRIAGSVFVLAHDPLSSRDRGFYAAARLRGSHQLASGWLLRVEESPWLQRRDTASLSDFARNDVSLQIERQGAGPRLGIRVADRRRSVRADPVLDFTRQWLSASLSGGGPRGWAWRVEAGPQHYATDVASGWRAAAALEVVRTFGSGAAALRLGWIGGEGVAGALTADGAPTAPTGPQPTPPLPPAPAVLRGPLASDTSRQFAPPPPSLLGPGLVIDPVGGDESDWDFGRRKQELLALVSSRLGKAYSVHLELSAQRERGPDLASAERVFVRRLRFAGRLTLRRAMGSRAAVLVQGGWQELHDDRPGVAYSHGIASLGLELRP